MALTSKTFFFFYLKYSIDKTDISTLTAITYSSKTSSLCLDPKKYTYVGLLRKYPGGTQPLPPAVPSDFRLGSQWILC